HVIYEWEFSNQGVPCACQDAAVACKQGYPTTPACSEGPGTQNKGICVECTAKSPICDAAKHTCDVCTTDADCKGHPETPLCALTGPQKGACVECNQS